MSGPRLSIIPAGAVTDRSLEPRDLQVLCLLGRHTDDLGWCFRSQVKMAAELDCSRASLQRSLDRLYEAGWVEKRLRNLGVGTPDPKHPHAAHAYRVILDRPDFIDETNDRPNEPSPDDFAYRDPGCPPVGTPPEAPSEAPAEPENEHPGALPSVGTRCPSIHGHINDPRERPNLERERDARARGREARGLVDFETRWPTSAADDRQRTAYAWAELSDADCEEALKGIGPFLENLKRLGRKNVPAGWKYLEEKRWTLLEQKPDARARAQFEGGSAEAKALATLYAVAGKSSFFYTVMRGSDGVVRYPKTVMPQLLALAQARHQREWMALDRNQAGAWNGLLSDFVHVDTWTRLREGARAPWPWPPGKDGKIYATGPPDTLMTDQDIADLDQLK